VPPVTVSGEQRASREQNGDATDRATQHDSKEASIAEDENSKRCRKQQPHDHQIRWACGVATTPRA
jgi:hypothetical protein